MIHCVWCCWCPSRLDPDVRTSRLSPYVGPHCVYLFRVCRRAYTCRMYTLSCTILHNLSHTLTSEIIHLCVSCLFVHASGLDPDVRISRSGPYVRPHALFLAASLFLNRYPLSIAINLIKVPELSQSFQNLLKVC